ncbi:YafY family protein [Nocardia sp. CC227C]|uniref:helix-turn-helix transcriptional regulator n=1 Tax=Nocardia sp. CC227C TaxID=3044562 RepID=UPI00278C8083|nr:WYL domain-containing protein [Nocardia sp. CC227C]
MADVTRRMLELLAQLQTGRRFSGHDLAARLEISPRTLRRDVERLREYGYPVSTQPGPSGFYRLAAGRTLPPLVLDDDEAVATLVGLALLGATEPLEPSAPLREKGTGPTRRGAGHTGVADPAGGHNSATTDHTGSADHTATTDHTGATDRGSTTDHTGATDHSAATDPREATDRRAATDPGTTTDRGATIGAAADRAFGKIDQFLPKRLRPRVSALRATVETAPQSAPAVDPEVLATVGAAAAGHEYLTFGYTGRDGTASHRRVEPYRVVHLRLRWYLVAWDVERGDWRAFRIDRMAEVTGTARQFAPRPLPARSATEYVRAGMSTPRHRAVVTVAAPAAQLADALKYLDWDIEALGPDRCRVTTRVDSFEWLILRVGLLGAEFTIEEPAEFRDRALVLADRLRRAAAPAR